MRLPFTTGSTKVPPKPWPRRRRLFVLGIALCIAGFLIALAGYHFRPRTAADLMHGAGNLSALCGLLGTVIMLVGNAIGLYAHHLRQRANKRARHGQCEACGYDLRASTDRCPECGMPIAASEAKK